MHIQEGEKMRKKSKIYLIENMAYNFPKLE